MRAFMMTTAAIIGISATSFFVQPVVRAGDGGSCSSSCLFRVQYPDYNNMTPDQQYQERQREYREQQNQEYYDRERQQRDLQQQLERRRSNSYGAIAYSPDKGDYGYSERYANRAQAEREAVRECGQDDCEVAAWYYNSCGALAVDDDGNWGGAQGDDEQRASRAAVARCAQEGGNSCKVILSQCSR